MSATGEQIRRARNLAKLSQQHLSDATGVSVRSIGRIERGERGEKDDTATVAILRDYLGLSGDPDDINQQPEDVARLSDGQLLAQRRLLEAEWERRYFAAIAAVEERVGQHGNPNAAPRRGLPGTPPSAQGKSNRTKRLESEG